MRNSAAAFFFSLFFFYYAKCAELQHAAFLDRENSASGAYPNGRGLITITSRRYAMLMIIN